MSAQDLAALEQAKRNATRAKARVQGTSAALKQRLSPASLAADATEGIRRKTDTASSKIAETMHRRPLATSVAAGVAALIVLRKPLNKIARLLRRGKAKPERAGRPSRRANQAGVE